MNNFTTINQVPTTTEEVPPCPLCGKRFPTIEEVTRHASSCN